MYELTDVSAFIVNVVWLEFEMLHFMHYMLRVHAHVRIKYIIVLQ